MTATYQFAGHAVQIDSLHPAVHALCTAYRCADKPALCIQITQAAIDAERAASEAEDRAEGRPVRRFADDYLETLAVYRKIAEWMPLQGVLLLHGSAVAMDGRAYLFTAKSGTGKSTHTALWTQRFGARAVILNDDKPLVAVRAGGADVYGTPWDGKHHRSTNLHAPLQAICLLERAAETTVTPIAKAAGLPRLLQQVYRPADPAALAATLRLLDQLTDAVPLYRMGCTPELTAAEIAYEAMKGTI